MESNLTKRCILVAIFALASLSTTAQTPPKPKGNPTLDAAMQSMFGVRAFQQASISPDGKRVAWVESLSGAGSAPSANSAIYVADVNTPSAAKRISAGDGELPHEEHDIAWAADNKVVAFLSDAAGPRGQLQVFTTDANGGTPKQLTHLKGFLSSPSWSPDGKTIALLFTENATRASGPLVAETPDEGVVSEDLHEQRLALVDPITSRVRQISPADLYVYEFDWAPSSNRLVVTAAHGSGDDNWYIASLFAVDAASGSMKTIIEKPGRQITRPRWSPDGKKIAFIGGLMSDEDIIGGDIYGVSAEGGEMDNLTADMTRAHPGSLGRPIRAASSLPESSTAAPVLRASLSKEIHSPNSGGAKNACRTSLTIRTCRSPPTADHPRSSANLSRSPPNSGSERLANGSKSPTAMLVCGRRGANPSACTGRATLARCKVGLRTRKSSIP